MHKSIVQPAEKNAGQECRIGARKASRRMSSAISGHAACCFATRSHRHSVSSRVSFSEPLEIDAFGLPVPQPDQNPGAMSETPSARNSTLGSYDGLTLTLPKHSIDESTNHYPRWQMRQGSNASTVSTTSQPVLSAGLIGQPPTTLSKAPPSEARLSATSLHDLYPTALSRPTPSPSSESYVSDISSLARSQGTAPHHALLTGASNVTSPRGSVVQQKNSVSAASDVLSRGSTAVSHSLPVHPLPNMYTSGEDAATVAATGVAGSVREGSITSRVSQLLSGGSAASGGADARPLAGSHGSYAAAAQSARASAAVSNASSARMSGVGAGAAASDASGGSRSRDGSYASQLSAAQSAGTARSGSRMSTGGPGEVAEDMSLLSAARSRTSTHASQASAVSPLVDAALLMRPVEARRESVAHSLAKGSEHTSDLTSSLDGTRGVAMSGGSILPSEAILRITNSSGGYRSSLHDTTTNIHRSTQGYSAASATSSTAQLLGDTRREPSFSGVDDTTDQAAAGGAAGMAGAVDAYGTHSDGFLSSVSLTKGSVHAESVHGSSMHVKSMHGGSVGTDGGNSSMSWGTHAKDSRANTGSTYNARESVAYSAKGEEADVSEQGSGRTSAAYSAASVASRRATPAPTAWGRAAADAAAAAADMPDAADAADAADAPYTPMAGGATPTPLTPPRLRARSLAQTLTPNVTNLIQRFNKAATTGNDGSPAPAGLHGSLEKRVSEVLVGREDAYMGIGHGTMSHTYSEISRGALGDDEHSVAKSEGMGSMVGTRSEYVGSGMSAGSAARASAAASAVSSVRKNSASDNTAGPVGSMGGSVMAASSVRGASAGGGMGGDMGAGSMGGFAKDSVAGSVGPVGSVGVSMRHHSGGGMGGSATGSVYLSRDDNTHSGSLHSAAAAAVAALSPRTSLLGGHPASGGPNDLLTPPRISITSGFSVTSDMRDSNSNLTNSSLLLAEANALEEDLAAVMKRLPASLRYGAREAGAEVVSTALLQQLYNRLSRLQAALRQRDADTQRNTRMISDLTARLADSEAHESALERSLLEATQQLAHRDQDVLTLQSKVMEAERRALEITTQSSVTTTTTESMSGWNTRSEGGAAVSVVTLQSDMAALKRALDTARETLELRDTELAEANAKLAERDRELREAAHVLRASERELASQLQTAASRLLPGGSQPGMHDGGMGGGAHEGSEGSHVSAALAAAIAAPSPAQKEHIRELELQVEDLKRQLAVASSVSHSHTNTNSVSHSSSEEHRSVTKTSETSASSLNIAYNSNRTSVVNTLEQELRALTTELHSHQETMESLRLEAEHAKKMTAQERAAKSELESLVSRLRSDVVRAQEESGRLSAELDKARAQQLQGPISHLSAYVDKKRTDVKSETTEKTVTTENNNTTVIATDVLSFAVSTPKADLPHDASNQLSVVAVADMVGNVGIPISLANQWRKSLAQERGERQELAGHLEVAKAELNHIRQQLLKAQNAHATDMGDAQHRLQQMEKQLKDAQARLNAAEARIKEMSEESRTLRMEHATTTDELSMERDACRRLRLQVSVTQGSIDVLQKALTAAREDLAEAREQQLADALTVQNLTRQVEELSAEASSRLRTADDLADRMACVHLERLLELRAHPYLEANRTVVQITHRASYVPQNQAALEERLMHEGRMSRKSVSDLLSGPDRNALLSLRNGSNGHAMESEEGDGSSHVVITHVDDQTAIPPIAVVPDTVGSRRTTAASFSSVGSVMPGVINGTATRVTGSARHTAEGLEHVEWHAGLEVLQRHLQLDSAGKEYTNEDHYTTPYDAPAAAVAGEPRGTRSARSSLSPSLVGVAAAPHALATVVEEKSSASPARTSVAASHASSVKSGGGGVNIGHDGTRGLPLVPASGVYDGANGGVGVGENKANSVGGASRRTTAASGGGAADSGAVASRASPASSQQSRASRAGSRRASLAASADAALAALKSFAETRASRASTREDVTVADMETDAYQVRQHAESTGGHLANCAARRHYAADSALAAASAAATARSHSASAPGGADCDAMCAPYLVVTQMDAADAAAGIAPRASAVELLHKSLQGNVDVSEEQAEYERRFTR